MATEVTCIRRSQPKAHPSYITHIGYGHPTKMITREAAIFRIRNNEQFYVVDPVTRQKSLLYVVNCHPEYIRTTAGKDSEDSLLALPEHSFP